MTSVSGGGSQGGQAAAAAAKSLQSCPTLCDPRDGTPGSKHPSLLGRQPLPTYIPSLSQQLGVPERVRASEGAGCGGWPLRRGQVPAVKGFVAQPQFLKGPGKKTVESGQSSLWCEGLGATEVMNMASWGLPAPSPWDPHSPGDPILRLRVGTAAPSDGEGHSPHQPPGF